MCVCLTFSGGNSSPLAMSVLDRFFSEELLSPREVLRDPGLSFTPADREREGEREGGS